MNNKVGKLLCRNVQTHLIQKINNLYRLMYFIKDNTSHDNAGFLGICMELRDCLILARQNLLLISDTTSEVFGHKYFVTVIFQLFF